MKPRLHLQLMMGLCVECIECLTFSDIFVYGWNKIYFQMLRIIKLVVQDVQINWLKWQWEAPSKNHLRVRSFKAYVLRKVILHWQFCVRLTFEWDNFPTLYNRATSSSAIVIIILQCIFQCSIRCISAARTSAVQLNGVNEHIFSHINWAPTHTWPSCINCK